MPPENTSAHPLVGRDGDLARLVSLIGAGGDGQGSGSVLLAGDAGVGKTRLLIELRDRVRDDGWQVLTGHCLDFGDSALPYLAFSEMFGRLTADEAQLTDELAADYPAVGRLFPGRRLLSGADQADISGMDRGDLFEAVHAALERLGERSKVLVIVEDAHWADQSTRELLNFLFARRFSHPVSLVVSYRSDDLHRRHPLRAAVSEWSRLAEVSRVTLPVLSDTDVRKLVRTINPAPLRANDMQTIVARAEGNAFFTEELVTAAQLGDCALPDDLADLLLLRLDRLDDAARATVRAASVAGRRVAHELLSHVVDLDTDGLDGALRVAIEANVLVAGDAETYAFRHALLAEAVYDDLLPGERVRLHGAYADAIGGRQVDGTAADLARHARAAHDTATAVRASIEAGDDAIAVGGPDEAARHYEVALELLSNIEPGGLGADPVDLAGLTVKASDAITAAGVPHRSVALVQDALERLPDAAPAEDRVRLLLALAAAVLVSDTDVNALDLTTEALGLLPAEDATPLRAQLLSTHARANLDRQRDDDAGRWASEALDLAGSLGLAAVASEARTTLGKRDVRAGDTEASKQVFERVIEQGRVAGDAMAEVRGIHHLAGLHFDAGELEDALRLYRSASDRAAEAGRPWAPYGIDARAMSGITAYTLGQWDLARRLVDVAGMVPPGLAEAGLVSIDMTIAAGRGDQSAFGLLSHVRPWWDRDGLIAITGGAAVIDLHGDRGDLEAAWAAYDDVVRTVSGLWQWTSFPARVRLSGLMLGQFAKNAASVAEADRAGVADRAKALVDAAADAIDEARGRPRPVGPEGVAWEARVRAEHARLRWLIDVDPPGEDELIEVWETTVSAFEVFGHEFEVARSRAVLAAALRAVGRREDSRAHADLAREAAHRLGARPLLDDLRKLGTTPQPDSAPRREAELTAREHEILTLVAQGRSNSEIGRQLYISAKTVSVHVSNVLAKLGAGGRTEAAAIARRRGLLTE